MSALTARRAPGELNAGLTPAACCAPGTPRGWMYSPDDCCMRSAAPLLLKPHAFNALASCTSMEELEKVIKRELQ
jgi:hypothetical protein